jgi:hypothetical protein
VDDQAIILNVYKSAGDATFQRLLCENNTCVVQNPAHFPMIGPGRQRNFDAWRTLPEALKAACESITLTPPRATRYLRHGDRPHHSRSRVCEFIKGRLFKPLKRREHIERRQGESHMLQETLFFLRLLLQLTNNRTFLTGA